VLGESTDLITLHYATLLLFSQDPNCKSKQISYVALIETSHPPALPLSVPHRYNVIRARGDTQTAPTNAKPHNRGNFLMTDTIYKQYIDGQWVDARDGGTWELLNPATEEVIRALPFGNAEDAKAAIDAAQRAFPLWAAKTPYERADILKRAADLIRARLDDLARTSTLECGKPLAQSRGEWVATADLFEWFAEEGKRAYGRVIPSRHPTKRRLVIRQPLGVVGIITAWNFPAWNPARAGAAALAAGCTIVIRSSEFTPMSVMELVAILVEAGMPKGVVNLINGDPESMGRAMLDHPAVRRISFTGSTRVGKLLMDGASKTVTRLGLELGGNAPVLVFPDNPIEAVAQGAVTAKIRNNGQVCIAPQRFIVHTQVVEEFVDRAAAYMKNLKVGNGLEAGVEVGPLINAKQRDRVEKMVAEAISQGAEAVTGGMRPPDLPRGYFYQPTILANVTPDQRIVQEEIFGPVMPVIPFTEPEEALALANGTEYGLAAFVFTNDLTTAVHMYEGLEFGLVGVNEWYPQTTEAPFPGWKQSGLGVESGAEGLNEYLETKLVTIGGV
jgi:succinate-semialdehyde dehydrogenase